MSPPWGERMKPATSCTSRPRRCPIPCGRNTLVTALAIASSALQRVMSASRRKGAPRRPVAAPAELAGLAEAVELVGRFDRARKIQPPHEVRGIERADAPPGELGEGISDVGGAGEVGGQLTARAFTVGHGAH